MLGPKEADFMYVSFNELSDKSRIWVYQSDVPFTKAQTETIALSMEKFLDQWAAHGKDLKSSYSIHHQQFLIVGVDEDDQASGCSIDSSVHFIRSLEDVLGIRLLERNKIPFVIGNDITLIDVKQITSMVEKGIIRRDTRIFNNAITTKAELETTWIQAAEDTWIRRYFN